MDFLCFVTFLFSDQFSRPLSYMLLVTAFIYHYAIFDISFTANGQLTSPRREAQQKLKEAPRGLVKRQVKSRFRLLFTDCLFLITSYYYNNILILIFYL